MKITITNAYTWYNKGDAGILLGTVNTLKQIYNKENLEINVLSFTPEEDKKRYCVDKNITDVYSNVLNPYPYKHTKLGKLKAILKLIFKMIYLFVYSNININYLKRKYKEFDVLDQSDIIVVCGGGFLGGKKLDSLMHVFQMYINTKFNKPVYVMGTSIEPINNKIVKKYTNCVLKKMTHVFAREIITYRYLKNILPENKFSLIPDMAFMLEDYKKEFTNITDLKKKSNNVYGITVRNWNFPNSYNSDEMMTKYVSSLKELIEYEIEKNNNSFVFVPQVIVDHGNDTEIAKKIQKLLKIENQKRFLIIEEDLSPIEIKAMIGNFDFFIGTRMHSNIFAISMKIPTVAIAYEKKTNGIMHTAGLDDYVVEIDNIDFKKLEEKVELQRKNNLIIRQQLESKINILRNDILLEMNKILLKGK